jgi:para-nitrobenzyl esterase
MNSNRRKFIQNLGAGAAGLPDWLKYATATGETMIPDDTCVVKNDPERGVGKSIE